MPVIGRNKKDNPVNDPQEGPSQGKRTRNVGHVQQPSSTLNKQDIQTLGTRHIMYNIRNY